MIIRVTRKDIAAGIQGNASGCPIALAINRQLRPRKRFQNGVEVNGGQIQIIDTGEALPFSKRMDQFVTRFDEDRALVKPTVFRIRRPKL